jgi:hypothetical protein
MARNEARVVGRCKVRYSPQRRAAEGGIAEALAAGRVAMK